MRKFCRLIIFLLYVYVVTDLQIRPICKSDSKFVRFANRTSDLQIGRPICALCTFLENRKKNKDEFRSSNIKAPILSLFE